MHFILCIWKESNVRTAFHGLWHLSVNSALCLSRLYHCPTSGPRFPLDEISPCVLEHHPDLSFRKVFLSKTLSFSYFINFIFFRPLSVAELFTALWVPIFLFVPFSTLILSKSSTLGRREKKARGEWSVNILRLLPAD